MIYLGKDNTSDSLEHWKYVYKKKVNGKWRYYYDESELNRAKSNHDKAKKRVYDFHSAICGNKS